MSPSNRYFADVEVVLDESNHSICRSLKVDGVELVDKIQFIPGVPLIEVGGSVDMETQERKVNVAICADRLTVTTAATQARSGASAGLNANPHDQILPCGGGPK